MSRILLMLLMATLAFGDIGKVTVVKGDASVRRDTLNLIAYNNMGLLTQDIVQTAQGRLQMRFNDKTVISLGRESRFVIKEYLYVENSKQIAATFKIEKGFVKTITGAIGKTMPDKFVLETSNTRITPHGTIWSVEVNDESEIYKVIQGRVTLAFDDGIERKIELLAGETASLKKAIDGIVTSFKKSKITNRQVGSQYENDIEQNAALVSEDRRINASAMLDDPNSDNDDGNNGHGNDSDRVDESNPTEEEY